MSRRSRRILLLAAAVVLMALVFHFKLRHKMVDFRVYHTAGQRVLAGESPYRTDEGPSSQFKYLPVSALCFVPPALLPLVPAKLIWFVVMAAVVVWILVYSARRIRDIGAVSLCVVAATVLVTLKYFVREIYLGQANAVLIALVLGVVLLYTQRREIVAGVVLGLAIALKPYAVVFLPYFAVKREFKLAASAAVATVLLLLLPVIRFGWDGMLMLYHDWWTVASDSSVQLFTTPDNISLFGAIAKWTGSGDSVLISALALGVVCVIGAIFLYTIGAFRTHDASARELSGPESSNTVFVEVAILLALIPLISPQGWDHVFVTAVPGVMLLLALLQRFGKIWRWMLAANLFVIAFSLYDLMGRGMYRAFMNASVLTVCFLIVVGYLLDSRVDLSRPA